MKFTITPYHFEQIHKKGFNLDLVYLLKLVEEEFDIISICNESVKLETLRLTLIRKDLLTEDNKLTLSGQELVDFMSTKEKTKLIKKKPLSSEFEEWWKTFPGTDTFIHKGSTFVGCRSLKAGKEDCRLKFEKILNEGEYKAEQLIGALALDVQQKKDSSVQNKTNKLTYLQNSLTYLNQRSYEPFIELLESNIESKSKTQSFGGTDI